MARIRPILFSPSMLLVLALPALIVAGEFPCGSVAHVALCALSALTAIAGLLLDWRRERNAKP